MGTQGIQQFRTNYKGSPIDHNVGIIEEEKCEKTWKGKLFQMDGTLMTTDNTSTDQTEISIA